MGCMQSRPREQVIQQESLPDEATKRPRLSSLPLDEANERVAAARLVREVHAAKALLKACPLSSAPHDSGVLAPDERCNDLVRAVDKSDVDSEMILHAMESEAQFACLDPVARRALMSTMYRQTLEPKQSVCLHDHQTGRTARNLHGEGRIFFGVVCCGALEADFVTELGPVWPPPLELGSVSQHSQHSRYSARGEGSGRGGTSHTSTRRSIDLPDVLAPIVDIYNDSEINLITSLKLLPGSAFGTDPCITTMTALQPTEVWVLDFRAFLVILTVFTDEVEQEKRSLLASVPSFQVLSTEQLEMLVGALERCTYEDGEKIVNKGEVGDTFYLVQSGEVQVEEEYGVAVTTLGAGQFFGERAILQDTVRNATVISAGRQGTMCYRLDRASFQDLLGPIEHVWRWRTLRGVALLAALSDAQVMELVLALSPVHLPAGGLVFRKGDEGNALFIVESGAFQVLMSPSDRRSVYGDSAHVTSPGSKSSDLARNFSGQGAESSPQPAALEQAEAATWLTRTLPTPSRPTSIKEAPIMVQRMKSLVSHSFNVERNDSSASRDSSEYDSRESALHIPLLIKGDVFGEYALLSKHPRSATVQCTEGGVLLELTKDVMRKVVGSISLIAEQWRMGVLKSVPLLSSLTTAEKRAIAHAMTPCSLDDKEAVFKKNDLGDCMYVLEHGNVRMECPDNPQRTLAKFGPGSYFGYKQAVYPGRRTCTVTALGTPLMLVLTHENLGAILGAKMADLQEAAEGTVGPALEARPSAPDVPRAVTDVKEVSLMGIGAYGKVSLVRYKGEQYALKAIMKKALVKMQMVTNLDRERAAMIDCQSSFSVRLLATYQDPHYVYMLMEPGMGGDLRQYTLRLPNARLPETHVKFYVACCVQALKSMHATHYVHRDLKTENLLFMRSGYLKLADFGFAKQLRPGKRTFTCCGTPLYMAPEIIGMTGHSFAVDWWSTGVLMYELLCGFTPFGHHKLETAKLRAIQQGHVRYPSHVSVEAKSLIEKLLATNPAKRLGNMKRKEKDITSHAWFAGFDWDALAAQKMPVRPNRAFVVSANSGLGPHCHAGGGQAPYIPMLKSNEDVAYVDRNSDAMAKKLLRMQQRYLCNPTISTKGVDFPNF